jgi:hypothetical protein
MDSNIAVNLQAYQQQSLAERQQLKRLVLQNEARQEQSEVQCEWDRPAGEGQGTDGQRLWIGEAESSGVSPRDKHK